MIEQLERSRLKKLKSSEDKEELPVSCLSTDARQASPRSERQTGWRDQRLFPLPSTWTCAKRLPTDSGHLHGTCAGAFTE